MPVNDQGHWSAVQGCALSADGRIAASASADQTLILWDTTTGRALRVLTGHTETVNACAFSAYAAYRPCSDDSGQGQAIDEQALPDEQEAWIVSASADGTLRLWRSDGDELLQTLSGHTDWVNDCAVSAAAGLIVSAANDSTAKVWGHEASVNHCTHAPDGSFVVSVSSEGGIKVWRVADGQCLMSIQVDGSRSACVWTGEGESLAGGGWTARCSAASPRRCGARWAGTTRNLGARA